MEQRWVKPIEIIMINGKALKDTMVKTQCEALKDTMVKNKINIAGCSPALKGQNTLAQGEAL